MNENLHLGTPVKFTWSLVRRAIPTEGWGPWPKRWVTEQYPGQREPEPREGIVIGVRTLANGENHGGGWDDPIIFRPTEHFKAYLVAHDLRRKPVLVLPEHLDILT